MNYEFQLFFVIVILEISKINEEENTKKHDSDQ